MGIFYTALRSRAASGGAEPFVTWYATGQRAELSVASFLNAVAKSAGLLVDELASEPGDRVNVDLPLHWQLPVWLAAADIAGLHVTLGPEEQRGEFALFADADAAAASRSDTRVLIATGPFGLPGPPPPGDVVDQAREAMGQPDVYTGPVSALTLSARGQLLDEAAVAALARERAAAWGLSDGGRLLCTLDPGDPDVVAAAWAAPLLLGASVVLAPPDADLAAAQEAVTART